jgi:Colicin immunity protein / pyocin immunity protein
MEQKLSVDEMVELIRKIMNAEGTEEELDMWEDMLESNLNYPGISDLIYYPDREMTPEEIIKEALAYKPIELPGSIDKE